MAKSRSLDTFGHLWTGPASRYHRFTVVFESPSEDSLVFNVDSCEDPEADVESLKVVNFGDGKIGQNLT